MRKQLFGAIFIEAVSAAPPAPSTLSLNHFDVDGAIITRVTPTGWLQGSDVAVTRVTPTGWDQALANTVVPSADEIPTVTWTFAGGTELDTAQKKFGSASALFPAAAGGGASAVNTSFTSPHAGDWTFEPSFFRAAANSILLARLRNSTFDDGVVISLDMTSVPGVIAAQYIDSGGVPFLSQVSGAIVSADTWYHAAVVRDGTSYSLYFNGNRIATNVDATNIRSVTE